MNEFFASTTWTDYLFPIVSAILIFLIGLIINKLVSKYLVKVLQKTKLDSMLHRFIQHGASIAIWVIVAMSILGKFGIDSSTIITVLAACGAAVALALQGSLSNLASGLLIMASKQFKSGDVISAAGETGTVKSIDLLYTTIVSPDLRSITIPNASLTGGNVINITATGKRRIDVNIGISYNSNVDEARKALIQLASSTEGVLADPAPACDVIDHADSAIILFLRYWVEPANYDSARFFINNNIKKVLDANGVEIPYPQMDVHVKNM